MLGRLANNAPGRFALANENALIHVLPLLDDPVVQVRLEAYEVFSKVSSSPAGAQSISTDAFLPIFVRNIGEILREDDSATTAKEMMDGKMSRSPVAHELLERALMIILACCHTVQGQKVALAYPTLPAMVETLQKTTLVRGQELAAKVIAALSLVSREAKQKALAAGAVDTLIATLESSGHSMTRAAAASGLMGILVDDHGKALAFKSGLTEVLLTAMGDNDEHVLLNVLKIIACMAQYPPARKELIKGKDQLEEINAQVELNEAASLTLKNAAKAALQQVIWSP